MSFHTGGYTKLHLGLHHTRPRSRCRGDEAYNLYPEEFWPPESRKHNSWHVCFSILTPEEAVEKVLKYTDADGNILKEFFDIFFRVREKYEGAGIRTDDVIIEEEYNLEHIEERKEAFQIVFPGMNGFEAVEWINREFIRKEWLPAYRARLEQEEEERRKAVQERAEEQRKKARERKEKREDKKRQKRSKGS